MHSKKMTTADTLGLGFMTFAFFLGAGNLIFPPLAGHLAGENMTLAMLGFLITAVTLPLMTLIAVAKANGKMMTLLPPVVATLLGLAIYIILGPAFALPRAGLVAYEMGFKPFLSDSAATFMLAGVTFNVSQLLYSLLFFSCAMLLALYPGKLLDSVGKVLTPIMLFLLVILAFSVFMQPDAQIGGAVGEYQSSPLVKGILEGYNTMDTLAAMVFGILIIDILRRKGVSDIKEQTHYLIKAALLAAAGLSFVYFSLFHLGATAGEIAKGADNGGVILTNYVANEFGALGQILLATVVTLACLTTVIGLVTACSEFFHEQFPRCSYRSFVVLSSLTCATVANVGLAQLISISVPVLYTIYPVIIALVFVTLLNQKFVNPRMCHRFVLGVAFIFGCIDGLKACGIDMSLVDFMPLYSEGMAWLLPTAIAIVACMFVKKPAEQIAVN